MTSDANGWGKEARTLTAGIWEQLARLDRILIFFFHSLHSMFKCDDVNATTVKWLRFEWWGCCTSLIEKKSSEVDFIGPNPKLRFVAPSLDDNETIEVPQTERASKGESINKVSMLEESYRSVKKDWQQVWYLDKTIEWTSLSKDKTQKIPFGAQR